ncbi:MAG: hypothetical protein Q7S44_00610 [bacterium]|nr:hypothetical protein [bacterium]
MLIWIALFLLVIAASFILALKSMKDFAERPETSKTIYSLYLIHHPEVLTSQALEELYQKVASKNFILSWEKLFKGPRQALVIYGPSNILKDYRKSWGLLELEDYSKKVGDDVKAWEVGLKNSAQKLDAKGELFGASLQLAERQEFWWQVIVRPAKVEEGKETSYRANVRVVFQTGGDEGISETELAKIGSQANLTALPQSYTSQQLVQLYMERSFPQGKIASLQKEGVPLKVTIEEVRFLLGLKIV